MALMSRSGAYTGPHSHAGASVACQPKAYQRRAAPNKQRGIPCHALKTNKQKSLEERIMSGEYGGKRSTSTGEKMTRPLRRLLASDPTGLGRSLALRLARAGRVWRREAAKRMPVARGDIREIVDSPVFVPLYNLYLVYGKIFNLSFGPKSFVIISDPDYARQILTTNSGKYSKGLLSEILDFVMGKGLIPADGKIWKIRRRTIVPALHRKYLVSMVDMFADCTLHGCGNLDKAAREGKSVNMENLVSRLTLDIIGKAVFNYDFDSLTHDDPVIEAVYTVLAEAEHRSTAPFAYWELPGATQIVPRQRRCVQALQILNNTLDDLITRSKQLVEEEDEEFVEEFLSEADPSILHFLIAAGEQITSKQLRDDLMTMLVAGHETTAAVLTWTLYQLADHPQIADRLRQEVDEVLGDRKPTMEDLRELRFTTRVINEGLRLYPQPPVLIRRALEDDEFDGITVPKNSDIFISVWNLHRSEQLWDDPDTFNPDRFGPLNGVIPNEVTTNFAYMPFGGGKRKCIGDQFALLESITALAMLCRRYDFRLAPDAPPVAMTTGATIHTKHGLYMSVTPRKVPPSLGRPLTTFSAPTESKKSGSIQVPVPVLASDEDMPSSNGNGSTVGAGLAAGAARH